MKKTKDAKVRNNMKKIRLTIPARDIPSDFTVYKPAGSQAYILKRSIDVYDEKGNKIDLTSNFSRSTSDFCYMFPADVEGTSSIQLINADKELSLLFENYEELYEFVKGKYEDFLYR